MRLHQFVLILACFFIGVVFAIVAARPALERQRQSEYGDQAVLSLADPSYSPHDVVRQQVESLARVRRHPPWQLVYQLPSQVSTTHFGL